MRLESSTNQNLKKNSRRLTEILSSSDDVAFLQLSWMVNVLQSDFKTNIDKILEYPKGAKTTDMQSPYYIHKWDIETLILLLLSTPKNEKKALKGSEVHLRDFGAMAFAVNLLRNIENSESAVKIDEKISSKNCIVLVSANFLGREDLQQQSEFIALLTSTVGENVESILKIPMV